MAASDPYARIAEIYDAEFDGATADIAGYARRGAPGSLLVLGCGTGRVCRGLEGLREVVGLDRSPDMIRRARAHPRAGSTTYVLGDMTDFDLGHFGEVIIPNAGFAFLPDRRAQLACLEAVARALPSGAPLTLDLLFPDRHLLGEAHTPERLAWEGRVGEHVVRRTREVHRDLAAQRLRLLDRFWEGDTLLATSELVLAWIFPREAEWMLEAGGFWLDAAWGDHVEGPLHSDADRLLLRAIRT